MVSLQIVLNKLGMRTLRENLYFGSSKKFAELGAKERDEQYKEKVIASIESLIKYI